MPPWLVGFFVDDVAQVVQPPRHRWTSRRQPVFARLAALPRARGEA